MADDKNHSFVSCLFYASCLLVLLHSKTAQCTGCPTLPYYYAYTSEQELKQEFHSSDAGTDCTFGIRSSKYNNVNYYLEVTWLELQVNDDMPDCKSSYIDLRLTRLFHSMGRICSKNIKTSKMFKMYSFDGFMEFKYHVGKTGRFAFHISYKIKDKRDDYLGMGSTCFNEYSSEKTGLIYSSRWPRWDYYASVRPCTYQIHAGSNVETKIYFMDIDLAHTLFYCNAADDNLQIRGTNDGKSFEKSNIIEDRLCQFDITSLVVIRTQYKDIYVRFNRHAFTADRGPRGFVAGYITYEKKSKSGGVSDSVVAGITCFFIAVVIVIAIATWYRCTRLKKRSRRRTVRAPRATREDCNSNVRAARSGPINTSTDSVYTGVGYPDHPDPSTLIIPPPYSAVDPIPRGITTLYPDVPPPAYGEAVDQSGAQNGVPPPYQPPDEADSTGADTPISSSGPAHTTGSRDMTT